MHEPEREALGHWGVTRRELDVLDAVAQRRSNAEIAAQLCVSERTVESHVSSLLHKLGAHNRLELIDWAAPRVSSRALGEAFPSQLDAVARRGELVGREAERARLLACWERSAAEPAVAVIRGDAGIGKSRLAAEVALEVHGRGGGVALGSCTDGPQRPYEPFMAAIDADLVRRSTAEIKRRLGENATTLAKLSPEVAIRLGVDPRTDAPDLEHEQGAVRSALVEYLTAAASVHQRLFVVEDLHWASAATRDVIVHLARIGGLTPLMLLVTTRDERPFVDDAFRTFLRRLTGMPSVEVVALSGIGVGAAARVIDAVGSELDPGDAVRQAGGNPLFLQELARHGPGSRSLAELVTDRFNRVPTDDIDVLDLAAVAGEQIDVTLVASAIGRSVPDVLDALEQAEAVGLVGSGSQPGWFAFAHDVHRSVRYASLSTSRRFRLHAALAEALRNRTADGQVSADLARHACLAGPRFDPTTAADLARQAGDAAAAATDHGEAVAHYRRALEALDLVPAPAENVRLDLSIRLGASLCQLGDVHGFELLGTAARTAQQRGDPVSLARAVCAMEPLPGGTPGLGQIDQAFKVLAETALRTLPPHEQGWRIRVSTILGAHVFGTDPARGSEMVYDAVATARRLGDPVTLGRTLLSARWCGTPLETEQRLACGLELIELGDRTGLEVLACAGRQQMCWCHRELGNRDDMDYWDRAAEERVHGPDIEQLSHAAAVALIDGDLARAEQLTEVIDDVWGHESSGQGYVASLLVALDDWRERTPDLIAIERELAAGALPFPEFGSAIVARRWARRGEMERARELLERARTRGFPPMYAGRGGSLPIACWAETAAIVADIPAAHELRVLLDPLAGRWADGGVVVWDTVDRLRALLRMTTGDAATATELAAGAVSASRRRRTPIFLGRELIVLAAAQQRVGIDESTIRSAIDEALTIARRTGTRIITKDAALFLDRSTGSAARQDPSGLTPREAEIIDLVAEGATNAQIAATLHISPATVRKHLEHAYRKLDVPTHTAAAAQRNTRA